MKDVSIAAVLALLLSLPASAQAPADKDGMQQRAVASRAAVVRERAVDPLYLAPPGTVGVEQIASMQRRLADWPELDRYRAENAALARPAAGEARVVFFGDSITEGWGNTAGVPFFPGKPYVNRGISGQTTAQMLVRFRQDVIDLHPAVVVILAGTNDLAGNTGRSSLAMIQDNLRSMTDLAKASHIRVVLASVLPVSAYPWRPGVAPANDVRALNAWISAHARESGATWLDYHAALANTQGGMDRALALDGVHPTAAGYAIMAPLAQQAIKRALAAPSKPGRGCR